MNFIETVSIISHNLLIQFPSGRSKRGLEEYLDSGLDHESIIQFKVITLEVRFLEFFLPHLSKFWFKILELNIFIMTFHSFY